MTASDDSADFLALLDRHKPILYKVANAYCAQRDDRNDLIQEIVIQLWRAWPQFDRRSRFATWMHAVGMNVAISFFRGESRRTRDTVPLEEFGLDVAAADRMLDGADDDMRTLHQLIGELDAISRAIILLYLEGYGHDEIASIVGITATNVATRINRIKQRLQRRWQADAAPREESA